MSTGTMGTPCVTATKSSSRAAGRVSTRCVCRKTTAEACSTPSPSAAFARRHAAAAAVGGRRWPARRARGPSARVAAGVQATGRLLP
eukprot:7278110-Prymnesium_polylepis.1